MLPPKASATAPSASGIVQTSHHEVEEPPIGVLPPAAAPRTGPNGQPEVIRDSKATPAHPPYQESLGLNYPPQPPGPIPTELNRVSPPSYTVAPPDVLLIDPIRLVPKGPYRLEPLEVLIVQVSDTLPNQPILGKYTIAPDGRINLGFAYGSVRVAGLTLEEAQAEIRQHLGRILRNPQVFLTVETYRSIQQVRGEHLVRPDGTINLGGYGCVYVAGMTLNQVKWILERHLSQFTVDPLVAVDVLSYNSKTYYVVFDGGGFGMQVYRFPYTGSETVLDAISNVYGLPPVASTCRIWVARPAPCQAHCNQLLPVDWKAIVAGGSTCTNYQLFPGDRVYVAADALIATDNWIAKILSPVERIFNITLLGSTVVRSLRSNNNGNNGGFIAVTGQ